MPLDIQNTTLAGAPYFDDFSNAEANNYHRVLFKPGVAVQARELTQLQTILQNQVERFGDNIYRRGTIIDGCNIVYDAAYNYIKVLDTLVSGVSTNVSEFANSLLQDSTGLQAIVVNYATGLVSQTPDLNTLYIKYINVGSAPAVNGAVTDTKVFTANSIVTAYNRLRRVERITITQGGVGYANTDTVLISANNDSGTGAQATLTTDASGTIKTITITSKGVNYTQPPAISIATTTGVGAVLDAVVELGQLIIANGTFDSVGTGYAAQVADGIIYQKGHFLKVAPQTLIISKYKTTTDGFPNNVVVGFKTNETIATSLTDSSLLDNATGSPNEMAPGADRLKLTPSLIKYDTRVAAAGDGDFLALVEFERGQIVKTNLTTTFNSIDTELSRRTYEESGDYVVKQFGVYAEEKLDSVSSTSNTLVSNTTHLNAVITPGIAYVNGLRTETVGNRRASIRKSTDTATINNVTISTGYGSFVYVNELAGNFNPLNLTQVTLYGGAGMQALTTSPGSIPSMPTASIGTARVRGLEHYSGNPGSPNATYKMYLYDVKMNAGKSFADTFAIGIASTAAADVVRTTGKAVLQDVAKDGFVFPTGVSALKSMTDMTLYHRLSNSSIAFSTSGAATISLSTPGLEFPYVSGSTLSAEQKQQIVLVPTVSVRSANLTGNVSASSGANTLTGTGTAFQNEVRVGDTIYAVVSGTPYLNRVTKVVSDTSLQVQNAWSTSITSGSKLNVAFPAYQPIDVQNDRVVITASNSTTLSVSLGLNINTSATNTLALYDARIDKPAVRIKKLRKSVFVKISASAIASNPNGPWSLGIPDVHKLVGVYVGTGSTYANPDTATNDVSQFVLNNGQNDNAYGLATIRRAPNATLVTAGTNVNIVAKLDIYYDHNAVSGGAFFGGVYSYPIDDANREANSIAITTEEIERYTSTRNGMVYDLRNCVDFRPVVANTADLTATTYTSATIDPSATETYATTINYMPSPKGELQADLEHYLSRIDSVSIIPSYLSFTSGGTIAVTEGTPSITPSAARTPEKSMLLANIVVPPYPSLDPINAKQANRDDLSVKTYIKGQQKRYTMRDVGDIEKRIDRLEYYSLLNRMESSVKDLAAGRTLNGFFTDSFDNFDMANLDDVEYNAFIDTARGELRPRVYAEMIELALDTSPGAKNASVNTAVLDQILLDYTKQDFTEQPFASGTRNLAGELWRFAGNMFIYPKYDGQYDQDIAPVNVTIDLASAQKSVISAVNQVFSQMDGRTTVLGTETTNWSVSGSDSATANFTTTTVSTTVSGTTTTVTGVKDRAQLVTGAEGTTLQGSFNVVADVDFKPFMRPQAISFFVTGLRPGARHYVFFDDQDVNKHVIPGEFNVTSSSITSATIRPTGVLGAPLRADQNGRLAGVFYIPAETFYVGARMLKVFDVATIDSESAAISFASAEYNAYNIDISHQQVSISTKQIETITAEWREYYRGVLSQTSTTTGVSVDVASSFNPPPPPTGGDPLAQTFLVPQELSAQTDGVFVTDIEIFVESKAVNRGITVQIRDVVNGYPGGAILPFASKWLPPTDIATSTDATGITRFTFDTPVFLNAGKEYAFVMMPEGNTPDFYVFTGTAGEADLNNANIIAKTDWGQGQMFTSVNNTAWKPHSFEDVKFKLKRAEFVPSTIGTTTLAPDSYEFMTLTNVSGTFLRGEKVAQKALTFKVGDVITTSGTPTISGVNTLYGSDVNQGDSILIVYGANATTSALTGTANGSTISSNLTGNGTSFTTDFTVGDYVKINNNVRQVINITNNTIMTLDAPLSNTVTGAALYKWQNVYFDILGVQQVFNDTTVIVDRAPKISTNSSVVAQYMKVVSGEVDRYREGEKKLFLKKSNASNTTQMFVKSSYASLNANSGKSIVAGISNAVANVVSVDSLPINYIDGALRTISPTGTALNVSYEVMQANVNGFTSVPAVPVGVVSLPVEGRIWSKSAHIANTALTTPTLRAVATLQTSNRFVSPAIDITPAQIQIMRNNVDTYVNFNQSANTTSGQSNIATVGSTLVVGMGVRGLGIPADTTITAITGNTVTMSKNATGSLSGTSLTFHPNETTQYGISQNKYISKFMVLADGAEAEDFRLWITAYRPLGTDIDVYAKFLSPEDGENINNKEWTLLQLSANTNYYSDPVRANDYYEFNYTLPKTPPVATIPNAVGQTYGNTTLTGVGTSFTSQLAVNDIIKLVKGDSTSANGAPIYGETDNYVVRTVTAIANTTSLTLDTLVAADSGLRIQKVTQPRAAFAYCNTTPQYLMTYHGADDAGNITAQYREYKYAAIKIVLRSNSSRVVPVVRDVRALSLMTS